MDRNFSDMLSELSAVGADFIVVGAYALAAHGFPRATGDIDIWVRPTRENAGRVFQALQNFGAPLFGLTIDDLCKPDIVFHIGRPPLRIDILTSISGVTFDDAWTERQFAVVSGKEIPVLSFRHLLSNKRASGRPKDRVDTAWLEEHEPNEDE